MAKIANQILRWATQPYAEAEGGLHTDVFRASILMLEAGYSQDEVFDFLRRAADAVKDRHVPDREIQSAIQYAAARLGGSRISVRWPKFETAYRAEIVKQYGNLLPTLLQNEKKLEQSPVPYLKALYKPTHLICVALSADTFLTLPRDSVIEAENVSDVEYITPSPMTAPTGKTEIGKVSAHTLDNTGPKRYQVIEFDTGSPSEHAAVLWHLGKKLGLVMIVYSGGKSLHGWFNVQGLEDATVQSFFAEAVMLGADPKMWSRCQFARLPAGTNHKTKRCQSVVLFNEALLPQS